MSKMGLPPLFFGYAFVCTCLQHKMAFKRSAVRSLRKKNLLLSLNLSLYKMFDKPTFSESTFPPEHLKIFPPCYIIFS